MPAATVARQMVARWAASARASAFSTSPISSSSAASNVGILAAETYVSSRYVSQEALEKFDGVSAGKFTVGLGQARMAFVDDREDINSICLTAVARLLERYQIDPMSVGRLEVGTESLVDKSKSTKTTLMQLFPGNANVEGATVMNACYGGTAALLNSAAWVESSEWDGRYAIFVAADIAVYDAGPARPTGGVGAVACLVGPNAPLALVPKTRTTHAVDVYDFYKPNLSSEYPVVDGALSQTCYLRAVDDCYTGTLGKVARLAGKGPAEVTVDTAFDHLVFHSPYNKLVQQSFKRMMFNDARRLRAASVALPAVLAPLEPFLELPYEKTLANRDLDKALSAIKSEAYARMVGPSEHFSRHIGNSYTGAVYANLLSLIDAKAEGLAGSRVGVFSYGSGAIATMLGLRAGPGLGRIAETVQLQPRLEARREASPEEFTDALKMREGSYGKAGVVPSGSVDNVPAGAFYLREVAGNGNRVYSRKA